MVTGYCNLIERLYAKTYFARVMRSMELWHTRPAQKPPKMTVGFQVKGVLGGLWHLGCLSSYRGEFWK